MKFHLISLGCSKNTADSEALANRFGSKGWTWTDQPAQADLLLINTCGFIKDAKEESLRTIMKALEAKKDNPSQKTVVFGCLVKRYHREIEEGIPEIDFLYEFLNEDQIENLTNLRPAGKPNEPIDHSKSWRFFTPSHIGILKIAEGCSNKCAYCAIPSIRGPFFSRSEDQILADAQRLADSGAIELSVVAQDITRYGTDRSGKCELPQLIKKLSKISGFRWIRLHYMHPRGLTPELIDSLFKIEKVLPYFDIPFQHASDRMMRLMNRHTSPDHIIKLIRHIRRNYRKAAVRTTFIVGFPGENDEEFQELLDFIELFPIDRVGAFTYSTEEGTPASLIIPKVPQPVKQTRLDQLMTLQQLIIEERNKKLINKNVDLIIDRIEDNAALARTIWDSYEVDNLTTIENPSRKLQPGDIVKARIIYADAYDFKAVLR
jgi:ribosomal protein S12 methylthiotransferase